MFGHTFLVAHNEMPPEPDAVTIEFLGKTNGEFRQYLNALITHIDGEFRLGKFILKNREYDFEDRNLWIYELNLKENGRRQIFNSISSDIIKKSFPYTFLNKNCSYYIFNIVIKNDFKERSIYTLPKHTILELKNLGYISNYPVLIETDQSKLINFSKSLDANEENKINQIIEGYSYPIANESWKIKKGLDLALTYKIPREPSPEKRAQYFNIKKKLIGIPTKDQTKHDIFLSRTDPIETYGDANLRFGFGVKSESAIIEGKIAQRDFYTSQRDGLSNSYLDIMKSAQETVLRYGYGLSVNLWGFTSGVIPHLGLRYFNCSYSSGFEADLGALAKLNYWLSDSVSLESNFTSIFLTKMPFTYRANIKLAARLNNRWTMGVESIFYELNNEAELSVIYGF